MLRSICFRQRFIVSKQTRLHNSGRNQTQDGDTGCAVVFRKLSKQPTPDPFHSFRNRRIISSAGRKYDLPAFSTTSSGVSALAAIPPSPNAIARAVRAQDAVGNLDRSRSVRAGCAWRDPRGALGRQLLEGTVHKKLHLKRNATDRFTLCGILPYHSLY
jgi:hypothetical protein